MRQILVSEVDGLQIGLLLEAVVEVLPAMATTLLPAAPTLVDGVIDLRGTLVPVLDLRVALKRQPRPPALADHLVVVQAARGPIALRVDRAVELCQAPGELAEALGQLDGHQGRGGQLARLADGLALIHDVDGFLSAAEAEALATALSEDSDVD